MSATGIIDHVVRPHVAQTEEKYLDSPSVGHVSTYIPGQWPPGVQRVVGSVLGLFEARTMAEHCASMPVLAKSLVWDAPPFLLSRKGSVRVSSYFSKTFFHQRFEPSLVEVRSVGLNHRLVDVSGTLRVFPRRTLLVPPSLLLPESVPIRSTITIGVAGDFDSGMVEMVCIQYHNLPNLPNFMRAFFGLAVGTVPHLLEPMWSYVPEFLGDNFYRQRRERTFAARHPDSAVPALDAAKDVVSDTAAGVMDYGVDSVNGVRDGASYLFNSLLEAAGFSLGRARAYTAYAADLASDVAGRTYATAANIAGTAAGVAAGTAQAAYDTAATAAGAVAGAATRAGEAAAGTAQAAAQTAYDTTARAAGGAYEAGAQAAEAGRDVGRAAAERAGEAADRAAVHAQAGAEEARRGYETGKRKPVEVRTLPETTAPAGMAAH